MKRLSKFFLIGMAVFSLESCANWPGIIVFLKSSASDKKAILFPPSAGAANTGTVTATATATGTGTDSGTGTGTSPSPGISSITVVQPAGSYNSGDIITIHVNFTEPVTSSGSITLALNNGQTVNCTPVTASAEMTCTYTVGAGSGQDISALDVTSVNLNGGSISTSGGGTSVSTAAPSPGASGSISGSKIIVIDNTQPTVANVTTSTAAGTYGTGAVVYVQVVYSENVTVTGTPQLLLETGAADALINYVSGSGTNTLVFSYTVGAGHSSADLDYNSINAFSLNGGAITDAAGNSSVNTLPVPGASGSLSSNGAIIIDTTGRTISITSPAAVSEGDSGTKNITFTVTLSSAHAVPVTVNYATSDNTATVSDGDYTSASGTVTINAGATTGSFTVSINGDTKAESAESFYVTLSGAANAAIGSNIASGTISNDDAVPALTITGGSINEGNSGTSAIDFTVTLGAVSGLTATVNYATSNGTATTGDSDYTAASGTLTFLPGETSKTISVTVNGDAKYEPNETFTVGLSGASNATIATPSATGTITNDDSVPQISINDVSLSEGNSGTKTMGFTVSLSNPSSSAISVTYATSNGTASSGSDFTTVGATVLNFPAGTTSQTVNVTISGDTADEADETFNVDLSSPVNATIADNQGVGTITNDDTAPNVTINSPAAVSETNGTTTVTFTVSLSAASGKTVTVDYATADGTALVSDSDYTAASGSLTFTPGQMSKTFTVTVNGDTKYEANETFTASISNPANAILGTPSSGTATINNDDTAPVIQFASASSATVNESASAHNITVSLSAVSGLAASVQVSVSGAGTTATGGTDFDNSGFPVTVTVPAGSTTATFSVTPVQDSVYEGNETVRFSAASPSGASPGAQMTHDWTITDDEIGITSAVTMDADGDGKIDYYKITFSSNINDSSLPGYVSDGAGTAQSVFSVAGYANPVFVTGSAAPVSDTANDNIVYLRFDEGASFDTGVKPDLSTTASPGVTDGSKTLAQISTGSVTEQDGAKPILVSASASQGSTNLLLTFSEAVYTTTGALACGSGGNLITADITYNNVSGSGAASVSGISESCGTDSVVTYTVNTAFTSGDGTDTVSIGANNIYDAANNGINAVTGSLTLTTGPSVVTVEQYDTDKNGKIDQLKITFDKNMTDSSTLDSGAVQWRIGATAYNTGGTTSLKVDTGAGGSGTVSLPNNDAAANNDSVITVFTDNNTGGTGAQAVGFALSAGKWTANSIELQNGYWSAADVKIIDKAPPVIISAVVSAADSVAGPSNGDTLTITFSEGTNKPTITSANIASILGLSNTHTWGSSFTASWNAGGDTLTITFTGSGATVDTGDTITELNGGSELYFRHCDITQHCKQYCITFNHRFFRSGQYCSLSGSCLQYSDQFYDHSLL